MSLSQISEYIEQKANEKRRLEKDIENMRTQIQTLEQEKSYSEELRDNAVKHEKMTTANLQWYSNLKTELNKYRIPIENLSLFAKAVHGIGQYGYDVNKIIAEFSEQEFLRRQLEFYRHTIPVLENKCVTLNGLCTSLGQMLNFNRQKLSQSDELEQMGFGLKRAKTNMAYY